MKPTLAILLVAFSLLGLLPFVQAQTTTSQPSSGYVTYSVQVTGNGTTKAASVTEKVAAGSSSAESIIMLTVQGTEGNFSYSHEVNSSLPLFPYLPTISSDNYTYTGASYSVTFTISQTGTSQVTFQGSSYTLTNFSYSAAVTSTNGTQTITGTVSTFPSDLVYSATAEGTHISASSTLTSTSLALSDPSAQPAVQATTAGVGISLAAGAVALSLGVKFRHKPQSEGPKPDHWVD